MAKREISELLDAFMEQEKMHHFEGDRGLERLNKLFEAMGYEENRFKYGSPLEQFIADNPGATEAVLNWVREFGDRDQCVGWRDRLAEAINEDEEEEDEEAEELDLENEE